LPFCFTNAFNSLTLLVEQQEDICCKKCHFIDFCVLLFQLEAMAQSRVADAAAAAAKTDERISKSLSALDICCHGTLMFPLLVEF